MKKHLLVAFAVSLATTPMLAQQAQFQDVVRMLRHPNAEERLRSVKMLREAGYVEAAEPVAPLIADPVDDVQLAAIDAELSFFMADDGTRTRFGFMTSRPKSFGLASFEAGPGAVKPLPVPAVVIDNLLTALNDENDRVRFEAIHAVGALAKAPLTVPQIRKLIAGLDHYDGTMRAATARVIARLHVKEAEDALIVATSDSNQAVRQFAMYALGEIKSEKAIPALTQQVTHYKSNTQATFALLALARIANPSTADLFRQYLASKDPGHRAASAEGLGRVGAVDFVPQLEQRLQSERGPAVQLAYFYALQKLGRNYLEYIVAALQDTDGAQQATEYLIDLGPSIAKDLTPYLASREENVRGRVAQILGVIGGPEVLQSLESAKLDRNAAVANAASAAVERIKVRQGGGQ
jgi:HEAT repeat protein